MIRTRVTLAMVVLVASLACTGETTPEPTPTPAPVASPEPTPAPSPDRGKHKGKGGKRQGRPGGTQDVIAAYVADCAAVFGAEDPELGPSDDECEFRPFDQSCAPDFQGCHDAGESCKDRCQPRCQNCQDHCRQTCDLCKSRCEAGDKACVRACAEKRAGCRDDCLGEKSGCEGRCDTTEHTCWEDAYAERSSLCPHCTDLFDCNQRMYKAGRPATDCLAEFPGTDPRCIDLCVSE
ncbi:MAG: hypothetical protein H6735_01705 [Alphaproteobacteria bacterium]|nr:hypothetical protein [Alphaproteobacteria bacterium]